MQPKYDHDDMTTTSTGMVTAIAVVIEDISARMEAMKSVNKMVLTLETIVKEGEWWREY